MISCNQVQIMRALSAGRLSLRLGTSWLRRMSSAEPKEVSLSVPWGHVAGKAWGDPGGKHVLAVHGWLDNAGTFDNLLPLLSPELHVVAVDLPGHGMSSHVPPGAYHCTSDYVTDIKYIVDALKWEKFSFLSHSMGGGASTWFAASLPEQVECMVLLEALGFWGYPSSDLPKLTGSALLKTSQFNRVDTKTYPSLEAALDRMVEGHVKLDQQFDRECGRVMARRGVRQVEDGSYQFTRDLREVAPSRIKIAEEVNNAYVRAVQCPTLITVGEETTVTSKLKEKFSQELDNRQIKVVQMPGGHHAHLYNPQAFSELIDSFLLHQTIPPQFREFGKL